MTPADPRAAGASVAPLQTRTGRAGGAHGSTSDLRQRLGLSPLLENEAAAVAKASREFPVRVPRAFVERMRPGDPTDPLLLQVEARPAEAEHVAGFVEDPLGEAAAAPRPGLLHKYRGRALLMVSQACPIHCRYCFRRSFPYEEHALDDRRLEEALVYLRSDPSLHEVILSGGDPLSASDAQLEDLVARLVLIPHLERIRVHTRWPIVAPERVGEGLVRALGSSRLLPVIVLHCNHAREIDDAVRAALGQFRRASMPLLNQAVLLRGVNDDVDALCELGETLFAAGVLPYYLHQLDPVRGAAHFAVPDQQAADLVRRVAEQLPGYLVPRLVREVAGAPFKTPVAGRGAPG